MTVAGNFWANSGTGANTHTKKPKALKSGKRVLIEGARDPHKNRYGKLLYHLSRGVTSQQEFFFMSGGVCQYRVEQKIPQ
jgi:hypothetical protein